VNTATGGAPLQSVVVSYGDGSSDDLGAVSGTVSVQHVYGDDGTFTPSVTATDTSGATATASTVIVVQPVLVSISASPQTTPRLYNFTANVTAGVTVASYTWTFGDGTSDTTTGAVTSHLYATAGNKEVTVTIRTSTNVSAKGVTTVTVP
jgi:PKD domain.